MILLLSFVKNVEQIFASLVKSMKNMKMFFLGNLKPNMEGKKKILNEMETYLKTVNDTIEKVIEK